jgi:serine protease Do
VVLGEMPAEQVAQAAPPVAKQTVLGLSVRPLTPAEKDKLQTRQGVVVEKVEGAAAKAGIRPGDVILSLNSEPVDSVERLKRLLEGARDRVAVLVQREDSKFFVPVPLS